MSLVSVIMSVYNEKTEWLIKSIESILNQTYRNLEYIIILDNPENMMAKKTIESYRNKDNRIIFIQNEINLGLVKSLNKGLDVAKGKYIVRMDADDISLKNRIDKELNYFKENNDIGLVSTNIVYIDENDKILYKSNYKNMNDLYFKKIILDYDPFFHPTWMFKKDILVKLKNYREVKAAEDYDFICRTLINNIKCAIIEENLLYYRVRDNGITKMNKLRQIYETERIKKMYAKSLLVGTDNLSKLDLVQFNDKKFVKFCRAIINMNEAKFLLSKGKKINAAKKIIKSVFLAPQRLVLKMYIFLVKVKY